MSDSPPPMSPCEFYTSHSVVTSILVCVDGVLYGPQLWLPTVFFPTILRHKSQILFDFLILLAMKCFSSYIYCNYNEVTMPGNVSRKVAIIQLEPLAWPCTIQKAPFLSLSLQTLSTKRVFEQRKDSKSPFLILGNYKDFLH